MSTSPGRGVVDRGGIGKVFGNEEDGLRREEVLLNVEGCGEAGYTGSVVVLDVFNWVF